NRDAGLQVMVGAPRQHLELDRPAEGAGDRAKHLHRFGGRLDPDPVAGNDRYTHWLGCISLNDPPYRPMGVRAALRTTTSARGMNGRFYFTGSPRLHRALEACRRRRRNRRPGEAGAGKREAEERSRRARDELEIALVRVRDAERHRQPETGAAFDGFRREERLPD